MNFGDLQQKIALLAMGIKKVILLTMIKMKCETSTNCVSGKGKNWSRYFTDE
jgi:hypothetical protein